MKRSTRVVLVGIILEVLLGGIAWLLLSKLDSGDLHAANSVAETTSTITTIIGAAMGGLAALLAVMWFVIRRAEK